jgi:hypothetical protein
MQQSTGSFWLSREMITPALMVLAAIGLFAFVGVVAEQRHSRTAVAQATPTPRVSNRPSANQEVLAEAYAHTVAADMPAFNNAGQAVQRACAGTAYTSATCKKSLQALLEANGKFSSDIKVQQVPPCLTAINSELTQALTLVDQGVRLQLAGANAGNASQYNQGVAILHQASPHFTSVANAVGAVNCPKT